MKKILLTTLVVLMISIQQLFAQTYEQLWKQVTAAQDKDLPQTEQQALRKIVQKADRERAYGQLLKAALMLARSQASVSPDSLQPAVERLAADERKLSDPALRAVYQTVLGTLYKENPQLSDDARQLSDQYFAQAVSQPAVLAAADATGYEPFLLKQADSRYFGHDLLSVVGMEADRYDVLHQYYLTTTNREAQLLTGLELLRRQRPDGIVKWGTVLQPYVARLDSLMDCYADLDVVAEVALERYQYMNGYTDATNQQKVAYIDEALARWPQWQRMASLRNSRAEMTAPLFRAIIEDKVNIPQRQQNVKLESLRAISGLTMKVYRVKAEGNLSLNPQMNRDYQQLKKLLTPIGELTQERRYEGHADYDEFDDSLQLPGLSAGVYMLEFASTPATEVSRHLLFVSNVRVLMQSLPNDQMRYVVVDAITGQPLPGAKVRQIVYNTGRRSEREATLTTDGKGECLYTFAKNEHLRQVRATTDADKACPPYNGYGTFSFYSQNETRTLGVVYADRAIYRPGQTVHAAAVFYTVEHGFEHKACADMSIRMTLRDANWQEVGHQEVRTDQYGTCSADFVLPKNGLTGTYTLEAGRQTLYLRVEEYKRPTFEVEFSKYEQDYKDGDTIQVRATARSYAGVPVQGARVKYKVERQHAFWWMSYWRYWQGGLVGTGSNDEVVAEGEAATAADGTFSVSVPMAMPPSRHTMFYNFVVTADVTDQAGETRQGRLSLPLGNRSSVLTTDLPLKVQREQLPAVAFHWRNAAGNDISATVRYQVDGGKWLKVQSNVPSPILSSQLKSGTHTLKAVCGSDTLERQFVVFSIDDRRPACQTDDWYWLSAKQFPYVAPGSRADGSVTLQVGSSAPDVHIVYTLLARDTVVEGGTVERSGELLNRKFTYKEEYGDGLLLCYAWVKDGVVHSHTDFVSRPMPDKQLTMQWQTFRDRLKPGQQEEWTLRITKPDGQPADAQLMATLYDKSLDQIAGHDWQLEPFISLSRPHTQWRYGSWGQLFFSGYKQPAVLSCPSLDFSRFDRDCYPSRWFMRRGEMLYSTMASPEVLASAPRSRAAGPMLAKQNVAIGAFDVSGTDDEAAVEADEAKTTAAAPDGGADVQVALRQNMQETAFFMPALTTDDQGQVCLKFTLPESLTTWRFLGVAHTADMMHGVLSTEAVAQKDVMVQPNMPRFVRQGDKATLTARLFNATDRVLTADARLQLLDPETDDVVLSLSQPVALEPQATGSASFDVDVAHEALARCQLLVCRWTVSGDGFSDGEQHYLPVLPNRERVTVTVPFTQNEPGTKTVSLTQLVPVDATQAKLTIEYTNNPAWLMLQALPTIAQPRDDDAVSMAAALYANTLGGYLMQQNPKARDVFEMWNRETGSETSLTSQLADNQELKDLVLSETPWVLDADRESDQKQLLGNFFDAGQMQQRRASAVEKLGKLQNGDGSWSWWPGMSGSSFMTIAISETLVRLNEMAGTQDDTKRMLTSAFKFMGREAVELVKELKRQEKQGVKPTFPSRMALEWLYVCALDGRKLPADVEQANIYLRKLLKKDIKNQTIYEKAVTAIILGDKDYVRSLKEYTVYREDMGRYYDTPRAGYSWRDYRIPTQVAAIEALQRLSPADSLTIGEMQRWLLQEKRTQAWDTPFNSIDAIYAFLNGRPQVLAPQPKTTLSVDGRQLDTSEATAGLGYVKSALSVEHPARLEVVKISTGTSWGAVYAQFVQSTATIADQSASGIKVSRQLLDADGKKLDAQTLRVGQRVRMRITIENDRDLDFVQVVDRRAACMEPVQQLSGYRFGVYSAPKDCTTNYYFDIMAKGKHVVETEYYIDRPGTYQTGTCTVQCAYAPEFRGTNKSLTITVTE